MKNNEKSWNTYERLHTKSKQNKSEITSIFDEP